ncbi:heavy-metal-associated domain-containing protein [Paenibacillus chartarius]|uniref:Heavy-metal-associated domain-containing protein n=1 Tax=Paenibacillus chartarius TaxID=747481 RepID=A0ABV6DM63_9BACL
MSKQSYRLHVEGMGCRSCVAKIEKAVHALDGASCQVDFAAKTAAVTLDPQRSNIEEAVGAIESIGYSVTEWSEQGEA